MSTAIKNGGGTTQARAALVKGNALRMEQARWRADLKSGRATMEDVLIERPACLQGLSLLRILSYGKRWGQKRVAVLNETAIRDDVNLALPLAWTDTRTQDWLIVALRGSVSMRPIPPKGKRGPKPKAKRAPKPKVIRDLPRKPFVDWLLRHMPDPEFGREDWLRAHGLRSDQVRHLRTGETKRVLLSTVDRALLYEDTGLWELYPELYEDEAA